MKKNRVYFFIIFFVILVVYFVRTANVGLGSNMAFYRDIFDYPNSEWICEEPKLELRVIDLQEDPQLGFGYINNSCFAIVRVMKDEKELIMIGGHGKVEIYDYACEYKDGESVNTDFEVFFGRADYKRNFFDREVTSFTIHDIKKDEIFNNKYEKIVFKRK